MAVDEAISKVPIKVLVIIDVIIYLKEKFVLSCESSLSLYDSIFRYICQPRSEFWQWPKPCAKRVAKIYYRVKRFHPKNSH